jgi:hypothetical protein
VSATCHRILAVLVICGGCAPNAPSSYFPNEVPDGGRYIELKKLLPETGRVSTLVRIRERPRHRVDGELWVMHWHRPGRVTPATGVEDAALDSTELGERKALEAIYGCREWHRLAEYHGNWGWSCLAPFVAGQPNWRRLALRIDDFRARRAEKRSVWPAGVPLDTLNPVVWDITVWTSAGSNSHYSLPTRPIGGILDSAAALYNAEGAALIDSIVTLARRH